jgi:hypothetical protein
MEKLSLRLNDWNKVGCRSLLCVYRWSIARKPKWLKHSKLNLFYFWISFIGDVLLLGKTNTFRYNHPGEAAKLRKKRMVSVFLLFIIFWYVMMLWIVLGWKRFPLIIFHKIFLIIFSFNRWTIYQVKRTKRRLNHLIFFTMLGKSKLTLLVIFWKWNQDKVIYEFDIFVVLNWKDSTWKKPKG